MSGFVEILKKIILISIPTLWCLLVTGIISLPIYFMIIFEYKYPHISIESFIIIISLYLPVVAYVLFVTHYKEIRIVFKAVVVILLITSTIILGSLVPDIMIHHILPTSYTSNPSHYLDVDIDEHEDYAKYVNLFPPSIPADAENVEYLYELKSGFSDYEWQVTASWLLSADIFTSELNRLESIYRFYKMNKNVDDDKNTVVYQYYQRVDAENFRVKIVFFLSEKSIEYDMKKWFCYE